MEISPETWQRVDPLLTEALALAPADRERWMAALRQHDPDLVPVVRALLATHERFERTGSPTVPPLGPAPASGFVEGAVIGPFRLVRMLGSGGMGEVWLADQEDIRRQVALKLPTSLEARSLRAERFARERDILAKLEHPHIARLYDAGATAEGQPWLAMEYVDGERFDAWLKRNAPSIRDRIALFRQVLAAVAIAHRHLVVHRDLKPANILVGADGQVKLLDFGIAKLVGADIDEGQDLTRIGGRVMTLRYAAPEQVAGDAITTATDIYSLGVVLHELLAGASPYAAVREGRTLNEATLLQVEVALPSTIVSEPALERTLAGDLDAILLKALRRDAAQRYATVEQFDDDLRRYLGNLPVLAREGTWRYLAGRFARRHRASLAVAGVVVVAIAAGAVMVERERRVTFAQKERAERHLASVRSLVNSLMFDVHDELREIPGALPARRRLAESAGAYLERISPEAGDDPLFRRELADAYLRLGELQGGYGIANLGQQDEALRSFDRALALVSPPSPATDAPSAEVYARTLRAKGQLLDPLDGRDGEALAAFEAALPVTEALARGADAPYARRILHAEVLVEATLRRARKLKNPEVRMQGLQQAIAIAEDVMAGLPAGAPEKERLAVRESLAWMASQMGHVLRVRPDPDDKRRAIAMFEQALASREERLKAMPSDQGVRRNIAVHHMFIGLTQADLGDLGGAIEHAKRSVEGLEALAAADPGNQQFPRDAYFARSRLSALQMKGARPDEVLATVEGAWQRERTLLAEQRQSGELAHATALMRMDEAEARMRLAKTAPAGSGEQQLASARAAMSQAAATLAEWERRAGSVVSLRDARTRYAALHAELAAARAGK